MTINSITLHKILRINTKDFIFIRNEELILNTDFIDSVLSDLRFLVIMINYSEESIQTEVIRTWDGRSHIGWDRLQDFRRFFRRTVHRKKEKNLTEPKLT